MKPSVTLMKQGDPLAKQIHLLDSTADQNDDSTHCDLGDPLYETDPQIGLSLKELIKASDTGPFSFALKNPLPQAWSGCLSPHYSLRYAYRADRIVIPSHANLNAKSSIDEIELGQEALPAFIEHFQKIASQCDERLNRTFRQNPPYF